MYETITVEFERKEETYVKVMKVVYDYASRNVYIKNSKDHCRVMFEVEKSKTAQCKLHLKMIKNI